MSVALNTKEQVSENDIANKHNISIMFSIPLLVESLTVFILL